MHSFDDSHGSGDHLNLSPTEAAVASSAPVAAQNLHISPNLDDGKLVGPFHDGCAFQPAALGLEV
jgi:hypothetical protein